MIPSTAHIIWLGRSLPPIPYLAARSALDRGGFSAVILHGDAVELAQDPAVIDLQKRGATFSHVRSEALFGPSLRRAIGDAGAEQLRGNWRLLTAPAMRADVIRLIVLYREGGVYLDADAICVRDVTDLLQNPGFAGFEHIALPDHVRSSTNPLRWAKAGGLMALRDVLSRIAVGPKLFDALQSQFTLAVNNAILGATPEHPTITAALADAASLPPDRAATLYELGPRLLQRVTQNQSNDQFKIHGPDVLYPLPPEMSQHYFRPCPASVDSQLITDAARVIHLYDSVARRRLGRPLDATWVLSQRDRTPFGRLVAPWLDDVSRIFNVGAGSS